MIPISSDLRTLLGSAHYGIHTKVEVLQPGVVGDPIDLTERLLRLSIRASIDDNARTMSATFDRGAGSTSLSPLMAGSSFNATAPLLGAGSFLTVSVAILAPDATPASGDWITIDQFVIDGWDAAAGETVTVHGRDFWSALFLDRLIEQPTAYGPLQLEDLIAEVVFDWIGPAIWGAPPGAIGPTLPGGSPGWMVNQYAQQEMSVLDACKTLALQIGWDFRSFQRYYDNAGFALYDPRAKVVPDAVIALNEYTAMQQLGVEDGDVRNVIEVWYGQATTRQLATATDAASVTTYGRRFMRIAEDTSSNIDTETEAQALADAALADLKDPLATHQVQTLLWPFVEINDLHQYPANNVQYDSDQTFAVIGYEHSWTGPGAGRTTFTTRGTPIAAYRAYRQGLPRRVHVSTDAPPADTIAAERALWCQVDDLSFPA